MTTARLIELEDDLTKAYWEIRAEMDVASEKDNPQRVGGLAKAAMLLEEHVGNHIANRTGP